jgi:hypothetical protein
MKNEKEGRKRTWAMERWKEVIHHIQVKHVLKAMSTK